MKLEEAKQLYDLLGKAIIAAEHAGLDGISLSSQAAHLDDIARADLEAAINNAAHQIDN